MRIELDFVKGDKSKKRFEIGYKDEVKDYKETDEQGYYKGSFVCISTPKQIKEEQFIVGFNLHGNFSKNNVYGRLEGDKVVVDLKTTEYDDLKNNLQHKTILNPSQAIFYDKNAE